MPGRAAGGRWSTSSGTVSPRSTPRTSRRAWTPCSSTPRSARWAGGRSPSSAARYGPAPTAPSTTTTTRAGREEAAADARTTGSTPCHRSCSCHRSPGRCRRPRARSRAYPVSTWRFSLICVSGSPSRATSAGRRMGSGASSRTWTSPPSSCTVPQRPRPRGPHGGIHRRANPWDPARESGRDRPAPAR